MYGRFRSNFRISRRNLHWFFPRDTASSFTSFFFGWYVSTCFLSMFAPTLYQFVSNLCSSEIHFLASLIILLMNVYVSQRCLQSNWLLLNLALTLYDTPFNIIILQLPCIFCNLELFSAAEFFWCIRPPLISSKDLEVIS